MKSLRQSPFVWQGLLLFVPNTDRLQQVEDFVRFRMAFVLRRNKSQDRIQSVTLHFPEENTCMYTVLLQFNPKYLLT